MSQEQESVPPTRLVLDLDEPMLRQALLDALELCRHPPPELEKPGHLRQWRCQVWVRLSYLLMHCSSKCSGNSHADLAALARHDNLWAQRLRSQDGQLHSLANHKLS